MAKKRFPSPANVEVDKDFKPKAPEPEQKAPEKKAEKVVVGKKPELVKVFHKGDHHIILHNSVHAIVPGDNWIDKGLLTEAKKHPTIAKHFKDGLLSDGSAAVKAEAETVESAADAADEKELDEVPEAEQQ